MYQVLHAVQAFDPSWAASNLSLDSVRMLAVGKQLEDKLPHLMEELPIYLSLAAAVTIEHTESAEDHTFTNQVLKFFKDNASGIPHWAAAARIVFAYTPNSAAAERVFSLLNSMFGDTQYSALADCIQASLMLRYNKRVVG